MLKIQGTRNYLYQWDLNQKVIVVDNDSVNEVHFVNDGQNDNALIVEVKEDSKARYAEIPNILLQFGDNIVAYEHCEDNGEYTFRKYLLEVIRRPKPADYVYTETEIKSYESLKSDLDNKIDAPQVAHIGEVLTVEEVGEDGKPKKWKTQTVETAPPDWDENDSTKPGYVKNRPGGFFTKQERTVTLKKQWDLASAIIPATDPQSTVLSIDGENRKIEFTYNAEYGKYFYADEGTGIEFYLTPVNSKYSYIYFETVEDGTHTVRLTELIPHEFYDALMPSSIKRNLVFIPSGSGEFTGEEVNAFSEIIGMVEVTKKYDNLPKYHPLLSTTNGELFIGGKFVEENVKLITINSLSSETQTFEDFVDTYGFIQLKVFDTNGYNMYTVPMYIEEPYGIAYVDGKSYYKCAKATVYINGHLFAFHAYQYAYKGNKLHSTLTVKRIL